MSLKNNNAHKRQPNCYVVSKIIDHITPPTTIKPLQTTQTLASLVRGVVSRVTSGYDVINILIGFEQADVLMKVMMMVIRFFVIVVRVIGFSHASFLLFLFYVFFKIIFTFIIIIIIKTILATGRELE